MHSIKMVKSLFVGNIEIPITKCCNIIKADCHSYSLSNDTMIVLVLMHGQDVKQRCKQNELGERNLYFPTLLGIEKWDEEKDDYGTSCKKSNVYLSSPKGSLRVHQ